ncbi:hypothetical protein BCR37DRAFT_393799 [Protomyces lactucae-debilis]|uniref:Alpha/Beta hydrolase protein n=1 Tax=Protomyces lactucae-debilis TaxID=2754530 RepID=A0A1Y2F951_PROLT|nr:uncharacterized protein BCR37DRAFT_393799 [Protomyces lactucae-debilis]ORY80440.1 hypothetical protein BCR37DRAFT_393799 [Protomyces lactucae-debilis]
MLHHLSWEIFQSSKFDLLDEVEIIIWGHSIGAGFTVLSLQKALDIFERDVAGAHIRVHIRLVLETPFVNTRSVLHELYPQRWLPYRYLGPFLKTKLDMARALEGLTLDQLKRVNLISVHIIAAGDDEILGAPKGLPAQVHQLMQAKLGSQGAYVTFDDIKGLHASLLTMTSFQSRLAQRLTEKGAS